MVVFRRRDLQSLFKPAHEKKLFCLDGSLQKAVFSSQSESVCCLEGTSPRMSELLTYLHLEDRAESAR